MWTVILDMGYRIVIYRLVISYNKDVLLLLTSVC